MLLALLTAAAWAGDRDAGWVEYLYDTQRYDEAATLAEALLDEDPADLDAHRMLARVRGKGMREGGVVEAEYRAWLAQDPEDDVRKVALAQALTERSGEAACEEVGALLMPLPEDPEVAWQAVSVLRRAKRDDACPPQPSAEEYHALRAEVGAPPGVPKTLDDDAADTLRDLWRDEPRRIGASMWLWMGHYDGPALERARREALEAMDRITASDDVPAIKKVAHAAMNGDDTTYPKTAPAQARLDELDPGWDPHRMPAGEESRAIATQREANTHVDPARALQRLDALSPTVANDGRVRTYLEVLRADRLEELGRPGDRIDALEAAWRAQPDDPDAAAYFAYHAHQLGLSLPAAMEAIDRGVRRHAEATHEPTEWPWATSYAAWLEEHREQAARLSDLRQALAEQTGTPAAPTAPPASSLDARHHLAVGLAQPTREGNRHLVHAAVTATATEVREQAKAALRERDPWFLAGLEAHLAAWESGAGDADAWPVAFTTGTFSPEDPIIGALLPDVSFEVAGELRHLSDYDGLRVVEVWATWCPPCVPALAELDAVARDYESHGVTVIAIGTDPTRRPIDRAVEGTSLDVVIGWAPDGRDQTGVFGIPTTFVVDAQGNVLDQMHGAVEREDRLRATLDAALTTP